MKEKFRIETSNYSSAISDFDKDSFYIKRKHNFESPQIETDVMGRLWTLVRADLTQGQLGLGTKGKIFKPVGLVYGFVPPFAVIEWHLITGTIEWEGVFSFAELPDYAPKEAVAFPSTHLKFPTSLEEIWKLFKEAKSFTPIGKENDSSAISRKTKEFLDANFQNEISLSDVASHIGTSHSVMSRYFKRCYGISPIVYINELRMAESMRLIVFRDSAVSLAAYESGFGDLSRMNRQFGNKYLTVPSSFSKKNMKDKT